MSSFWVLTRTQTWTLESQIQDLEAVIHHNLGLKHLFPLANRRLVTLLLLQLATEALTPSSGLMVWVTNKALDYPRSSSSRNKWLSVAACGRLQISPCQVYRSVYVKCLFTKAKQKSQSRQTKSVGNTLSQTSLGSAYNRRKKALEFCTRNYPGVPKPTDHTVSQGRKDESLQDTVQVPAGAPGFNWPVP